MERGDVGGAADYAKLWRMDIDGAVKGGGEEVVNWITSPKKP